MTVARRLHHQLTNGLAIATGPGRHQLCVLCGTRLRRFVPGPGGRQPRARCPRCNSLQRHRLLWLYLHRQPQFTRVSSDSTSVLHIAPEPGLAAALQALPAVRLTAADLDPSAGQLRADLQALPFGDQQFDVVIANHVLEHVHDDLAAFREVHRVLKPGGFAVLQVPVNGPTTRSDPAATPEERLRLHGQRDHVRTYGRDVADRVMAAAPLTAAWVDGRDLVSVADRHRFGLSYAPDFGIDLNTLREAWEIHRYDRPDGATRA